MTQIDKAQRFKALHVPGDPVVLYNIWDAGSAKELDAAGAPAIATGSWSVAAAQGYGDGQKIPLALLLQITERITETVESPVTIDFEGGYAEAAEDVTANVRKLVQAGAVGLNFEDQIVGGSGLYPIGTQAARIAAVRAAGEAEDVPIVINARTDIFLKARDPDAHGGFVAEALDRCAAYAEAGADCFFIPGLTEAGLIRQICADSPLPVNVMMRGALSSVEEVAEMGVARASFGPGPYADAMKALKARYLAAT
ncbi:isocitrate lyase/phosphoenolpyruvate mutase family protein [Thalassococcus sp. S3]|uniref:isocitrate lyase/PEP mutase family protein n=1 Tax=Thalassococcus sp. S3 TaxID=2017482 RepID=UPI00102447AB|nr:isocitrate lyase/phosphoenolpyruvate mutase family protein [Thalassococcus sp. S3]QBF32117.1 phosphonomutase [Thalassococcus sp. S3]